MRQSIKLLTATLLSFALAAFAFAEPGVETITSYDSQGNLLTRCITPGAPGLIHETAPFINPPSDQSIIWTIEHPTAVAQDIDITGDGVHLITGWWLNEERTSKYTVQGIGVPIWEFSITPNFFMPVSASDDGNVLASTGDVIPLNVWLNGAGPNPSWQFSHPPGYNGVDCNVSDDGTYIAAVCREVGADNGKLFLFNAPNAAPIWEVDFNGESGVNGVEISENNNWILVTTYWSFYVYDLLNQSLFYTGINYSQTMGGIDDDAEWLATGDFSGQLHVYQRTPNGYTEQWSHYMGGWVTAVDISSNASAVMAGNFVYSPSYAGEVKAFDINGNLQWSYDQYGDYLSDVALCNDGSVGLASSWGQMNATFGDVFTAFEFATGDVIFRLLDDIDEPGTIWDVAISDDGAYAVCGGKEVHARISGNGGEVYSIELGLPGPFDIWITMTPDTLPTTIPPGGGEFGYTVEIINNETIPVTFDAWIEAVLPNGHVYGPIVNRTLTLSPGGSIARPMTQSIPAHAPAGDYQYYGKVGDFPGNVWDDDYFTFTKSGIDAGNMAGGWVAAGWEDEPASGLSAAPSEFILHQNHPNPFNPSTTIDFRLPEGSRVEITVYNIRGEMVETILSDYLSGGSHSVEFNAGRLTSGVYFYRLKADGFDEMRKMIFLK